MTQKKKKKKKTQWNLRLLSHSLSCVFDRSLIFFPNITDQKLQQFIFLISRCCRWLIFLEIKTNHLLTHAMNFSIDFSWYKLTRSTYLIMAGEKKKDLITWKSRQDLALEYSGSLRRRKWNSYVEIQVGYKNK